MYQRQTEDFYILRLKASFLTLLQKGGNKIRQIKCTTIIPECWFEKYLLSLNGQQFGDTANNLLVFVRTNAENIHTTNPKNDGNCPYHFLCQWMRNENTLVMASHNHNEWVNIYQPMIQYSYSTNELLIYAKVTWTVDKGRIWCTM